MQVAYVYNSHASFLGRSYWKNVRYVFKVVKIVNNLINVALVRCFKVLNTPSQILPGIDAPIATYIRFVFGG